MPTAATPSTPSATALPNSTRGDVEANRAIALRFIDELWNRGKLDIADEIFAADCIPHTHTHYDHSEQDGERRGPHHIKRIVAAWRAAFPDWHIETTNLFADGDKVVLLTQGRGKHLGELMGIAPTGRRVTFTGMRTFRMVDGKIAEYWVLWDWLGLWQQLGTIPPRHQPRSSVAARLRQALVPNLVQSFLRAFFRGTQRVRPLPSQG
jgi:predicted ester cyclase